MRNDIKINASPVTFETVKTQSRSVSAITVLHSNKYFRMTRPSHAEMLVNIYAPCSKDFPEKKKILRLSFHSLAVSLRTTRFNIEKFYMVLALR